MRRCDEREGEEIELRRNRSIYFDNFVTPSLKPLLFVFGVAALLLWAEYKPHVIVCLWNFNQVRFNGTPIILLGAPGAATIINHRTYFL